MNNETLERAKITTKLNKTNPVFLPSQFLYFYDAFKEKLTQYGCK
ncbi:MULTISPECIES: hypothetical protein [unclassified Clostridium]